MYKNTIEQAGDFLRDSLDLASRDELYELAKAHNVTEIDEAMYMGGNGGEKMKRILRAKGLSLKPKLKLFEAPANEAAKVSTFDDFINEPAPKLDPRPNPSDMTRAQLAKECKARGIKMARTDSKEKLQERLSA